jgi:hypothetical protein
MRRAWIGVLICIGALVACSDQTPKLSNEEVELLDAVIFALDGVEDNSIEKFRLVPWKRLVVGRTIEFSTLGNSSIYSSDDDFNAKTRSSKFIRYTKKITSPEKCVFRTESLMEWSKGDSTEEFTAYREDKTVTINLMNAYNVEMEYEYPTAAVFMQGPSVACTERLWCENWLRKSIDAESNWNSREKPHSIRRREGAIAFIKKACPGKPY